MYEAYFNLQKRPFSSTPDASCFFAPESIQETFDELILRAESGQGIGILTAQAGTGKTLLCRRLAAELASRWTPVFLANANFPTRRALLQSVLFELGKPYSGLEEQELRLAVYAALRDLTLAGRGVVLIVDEAHLLSDRLLEELRLLASLAEGRLPLARVILAGQPLLEERMLEPALEALNQRVACHVYLEPLTRRQSIEYVEYRIEWAGGICSQVFTETALESIAAGAGGLPRCLNQLCDQALLLAYVQEQARVTRECVDEALSTLRQLPLRWNTPDVGHVSDLSGKNETDAVKPMRIDDYDDEACDLSSEGLETVTSYVPGGQTACFEIGGDAPLSDSLYGDTDSDAISESGSHIHDVHVARVNAVEKPIVPVKPPVRIESQPVSLTPASMLRDRPRAGALGAGVVPLPDVSPQALRGMVDELVVDRYARLDASSPRIFRTFDDTAVPEGWPVQKQSVMKHDDIPAAPELPFLPARSAADQVIAEVVDAIDNDRDSELQLVDLPLHEPIVQEAVEFDDFLTQEPIEIDDLLGSSVLDACLEVQAAIDGGNAVQNQGSPWWNDPISTVDVEDEIVVPESVDKTGQAGAHGSQYDVVEPEHGVRIKSRDESGLESTVDTQSDGRYVPKPKYRNIFSTLRRRIGRSK